MAPKPPAIVDLAWGGDLRFTVTFPPSGGTLPPLVLDSAGAAGPSPVALLAASLAGCISMDVAHILARGRHPIRDIQCHLEADRAPEDPHRLVAVRMHVLVLGDVPAAVVERAVALSHDKYCSVWHSLRQDIAFQVTCELGA